MRIPVYVWQFLLIWLSYLACALVGLELASIHPSATPIWPPTGLAMAGLLLFGVRLWPAVFLGALMANEMSGAGTLVTSLAISTGNTLEAVVMALALARLSTGLRTFDSPVGIAKFAVLAAGVATPISATIGVGVLTFMGSAAPANFAAIWTTWWLGDLSGALVITPLVVLWFTAPARAFTPPELLRSLITYVGALLVGAIVFSPLIDQTVTRDPLAFLLVLPLLWSALRRAPRDTAVTALIMSACAIWGAIANTGPFVSANLNESFLTLLTFIISTTVISLVLSADVFRRKAVETALMQPEYIREHREDLPTGQERRLSQAQRLTNFGSWQWSLDDQKVVWSDQLYVIYGRTPQTFKGTFEDFLSFIHPDDRDHVQKTIMQAMTSGGSFMLNERIIRPDGEMRMLRSHGEVIRDEQGHVTQMIGICQDVTDQTSTQDELHKSEQRYRLLVEAIKDYAIYMLDTGGIVASWNAGAERVKGYRSPEIIGRHFSVFYTPEDRITDLPKQALEIAARTGKYEAEGWRVRKDGTRFWANVVIDAVYDDNGNLTGFAKITRDVTERREHQLELDAARVRLAQAQKLEAIGQLTGGIAHDFNNLLTIVAGQTQILRRRLNDASHLQALDGIRDAAERGITLTRRLLTFARSQQLNPTVIDLNERAAHLSELMRSSMLANILLSIDIPAGIWPLEVDLAEFELALVNIAVNARDAMPNGGKFTFAARNVQQATDPESGLIKGEYVAVCMTDTGSGISADDLKKIFEPFFTTKDVGKGTGLGLAQVYGFAHQSGGTVNVDSKVGQGTTVTLYLPRSHGVAVPQAEAKPAPATSARHTGTVLIVEDDIHVGHVTTMMVEEVGYVVIYANSADEALKVLEDGAQVDLVFSDMVMPGMNGLALAEEISRRWPKLPILLASGYNEFPKDASDRFTIIGKPFDLEDLEKNFREKIRG